MEQLLIVEDDKGLNAGLSKALRTENREVVSCFDIRSAREQLMCGGVSLVILDVNLPDGNGASLLREIKKTTPSLPVILLTANDMDDDIVAGLEDGADDYITKPFSLAVLRARVNTQLRKTKAAEQEPAFVNKRFQFDFFKMRFVADGRRVELSKTEQKLLHILVENCGIIQSRTKLIDRIWTDGLEYVDENALSVTIKRLRDKLGAQNEIRTIYGIGYLWTSENEK